MHTLPAARSTLFHTFPSPCRSGAQRAVYEAVLDVHRTCLEACQPGATLRQLHHISVRLLADALSQVCVPP